MIFNLRLRLLLGENIHLFKIKKEKEKKAFEPRYNTFSSALRGPSPPTVITTYDLTSLPASLKDSSLSQEIFSSFMAGGSGLSIDLDPIAVFRGSRLCSTHFRSKKWIEPVLTDPLQYNFRLIETSTFLHRPIKDGSP